jgi:hypothetical protein
MPGCGGMKKVLEPFQSFKGFPLSFNNITDYRPRQNGVIHATRHYLPTSIGLELIEHIASQPNITVFAGVRITSKATELQQSAKEHSNVHF